MAELNLASKNYEAIPQNAREDRELMLGYLQGSKIQMAELWFTDLPGKLQYFSVPARDIIKKLQTGDGKKFLHYLSGFDGSSIRGFQSIEESDMNLSIDWCTAARVPYAAHPTVMFLCDVQDPFKEIYDKDPRGVAKRAEEFLASTGLASTAYFGPEAEFFLFDSVRYNGDPARGDVFLKVDSAEGIWNSASDGLGYQIRNKEGYFPVPPNDRLRNLRAEMMMLLEQMGIEIEKGHHEVATAGQAEIDMKYDRLRNMADKLQLYKYVVKNVAYNNGKSATFMPKVLLDDNGSGMHVHFSLWNKETPLFADKDGYAGLSEMAKYAVGGLLHHAPTILALAAPTINSYRRLVPGFEAPVNLVYSRRNRSAAIRIPQYQGKEFVPEAIRAEFRCPDPSSNPYLTFSAMLMAAIDGIEKRMNPGEPLDKDIYGLSDTEKEGIKSTPGRLEQVLESLESNHQFLLQGGVFSRALLESHAALKRKELKEWNEVHKELSKGNGKKSKKDAEKEIDEKMLGVEAHLYYDV